MAAALALAAATTGSSGAAPPPTHGDSTAVDCGGPTGWKRFGCDSRALGRRLALREPGDGRRALGVVAAAGLLYAGRDEIQEQVREHRSSGTTDLLEGGRLLSRGAVSPLLAGAFFLTGRMTGQSRYTETSQILLESTLFSVALAEAGSFVLAAERPEDGDSVRFFRSGGHGVSLDVALAASVVAPLDRRHLRFKPGDGRSRKIGKVAVRSVLYTAVGLTALARMDADKHWAPDVFLGAASGLAVGYSLCSAHEAPARGSGPPPAGRWRPSVSAVPGGILLSWSL